MALNVPSMAVNDFTPSEQSAHENHPHCSLRVLPPLELPLLLPPPLLFPLFFFVAAFFFAAFTQTSLRNAG
jgi:hypothetical protein